MSAIKLIADTFLLCIPDLNFIVHDMNRKLFSNSIITIVSILITPFIFSSCNEENEDNPYPDYPTTSQQTVIMYMPWSGSSIYKDFLNNISDFEQAICNNEGLKGNSLIVFISENTSSSNLIRISYNKGKCLRDTLKHYTFNECNYTTSQGITSILLDAIGAAPADTYAMTIGCHGMGWIPAGTQVTTRTRLLESNAISYPTRFFGHSSDSRYQTDVSTLTEGINGTNIKMEYILFDDCYMSNIETAYELKNVTKYLIASTSEIMSYGMPYSKIGIALLNNNYEEIVNGFYTFYSSFIPPCGTIGVTDCREIETMVAIMHEINMAYPNGLDDTSDIQTLDGLSPTVFFDFGDYVAHLCKDQSLLSAFNEQLSRLIPYKAHTETYYSNYTKHTIPIKTFSGITISDPTKNNSVKADAINTKWYKATH